MSVDVPVRRDGASGDETMCTVSSLAGKWKYVTGTFIIFVFLRTIYAKPD